MEAPAPASALIHSATLVSAGLFLFLKFYLYYKISYIFSLLVLIVGSLTCLFGSLISATQTDLKRLLAYSTISNCGLLFVSCVVSNHLNTLYLFQLHGLTKSLSFLFVGFIIINYNHNQDLRLIGSQNLLYKYVLLGLLLTISYLSA